MTDSNSLIDIRPLIVFLVLFIVYCVGYFVYLAKFSKQLKKDLPDEKKGYADIAAGILSFGWPLYAFFKLLAWLFTRGKRTRFRKGPK